MKITGKTIITFFVLIIGALLLAVIYVPYTEYSALGTVASMTLFTAIISFIFGLITNDYSWTDRLWSTSPIIYAWMYAYAGNFNQVVTIAAILVTFWGARLTLILPVVTDIPEKKIIDGKFFMGIYRNHYIGCFSISYL